MMDGAGNPIDGHCSGCPRMRVRGVGWGEGVYLPAIEDPDLPAKDDTIPSLLNPEPLLLDDSTD